MNKAVFLGISAIHDAHKLFDEVDINGDGSVSKEELVANFTKWSVDMDEEEVEKLFRMCDVDNSGTISRSEFLELYQNHLLIFTIKRRLLKSLLSEFIHTSFFVLLKILEIFSRRESTLLSQFFH